VKQERLKAYAEKKAAKPKTIAKSIVTLDVIFPRHVPDIVVSLAMLSHLLNETHFFLGQTMG
jgi:hypothetical protein